MHTLFQHINEAYMMCFVMVKQYRQNSDRFTEVNIIQLTTMIFMENIACLYWL